MFLQDIMLEEEKDLCLVNIKDRNEFTGILTGRDFLWGSLIRPSYRIRNVYFAQSMLETKG
jgi:hypothetical protein